MDGDELTISLFKGAVHMGSTDAEVGLTFIEWLLSSVVLILDETLFNEEIL